MRQGTKRVRESRIGRNKKTTWPSSKDLAQRAKTIRSKPLDKTYYHVGTFVSLEGEARDEGGRHIVDVTTGVPICNGLPKGKHIFHYFSFNIKDAVCTNCKKTWKAHKLKPWRKT